MVLIIHIGSQVFHKEGFQVPVSSQCWAIIVYIGPIYKEEQGKGYFKMLLNADY